MMIHKYQEDHKFFIRYIQQPRDYRVRGAVVGDVVSSNDDVIMEASEKSNGNATVSTGNKVNKARSLPNFQATNKVSDA